MSAKIGLPGLLVVGMFTTWIVGRSNPPATTSATSRNAEIDAGMDRIIPSVDFHDETIEKAIDYLREQTKANIVVAWPALEVTGLDRSTKINCRLTNLPLSRVLDVLAIASSDRLMAVRAVNGVIEITTPDALAKQTETHVYDVHDLIEANLKLHTNWNFGRDAKGLSSFPTTTFASPPTYQNSFDDLKKLITDSIAPDEWRDAGGTVGSLTEFNGLLIVTATPEMHAELVALLEKIREAH